MTSADRRKFRCLELSVAEDFIVGVGSVINLTIPIIELLDQSGALPVIKPLR